MEAKYGPPSDPPSGSYGYYYFSPQEVAAARLRRALGEKVAEIFIAGAAQERARGNHDLAAELLWVALAARLGVPGWEEAAEALAERREPPTEEFTDTVWMWEGFERRRRELTRREIKPCNSRHRAHARTTTTARPRERRPNAPRTASRSTTRTSASDSEPGSSDPPEAAAFTERDLRQLLRLALDTLPEAVAWLAWEKLANEIRFRMKYRRGASG